MTIVEIVLLVAGGIIFILSFLIPDKILVSNKKKDSNVEGTGKQAEEEIKKLVAQELTSIREHVDDVVEEAVTYAIEKTERSLERISNEKIMAVSEYSDTVLAEIHKDHEEAVFLYDMLNNKHVDLKNTVSEINRTVKKAEETVSGLRQMELQKAEEETKPETRPETQEKTGGTQAISGLQRLRQGIEKTEQPVAQIQKEPQKWMPEKISGRQTESVSTEGAAPARVSFMQETDDQGRNNNERILELYKKGKSTVAIAKELGLGVGEVKLVIDLFTN